MSADDRPAREDRFDEASAATDALVAPLGRSLGTGMTFEPAARGAAARDTLAMRCGERNMDDDLRYLRDMQHRIARIREYTRDGRHALDASDLLQDAVVRNIELIGYTWTCLSPEYRLRLPDFPWRLIGMRAEYLKHTHDSARLKKLVWLTVQRSVPQLEQAIRRLFPDLGGTPAHTEGRSGARSGAKRGGRSDACAASAADRGAWSA